MASTTPVEGFSNSVLLFSQQSELFCDAIGKWTLLQDTGFTILVIKLDNIMCIGRSSELESMEIHLTMNLLHVFGKTFVLDATNIKPIFNTAEAVGQWRSCHSTVVKATPQ